MFTITHSNPKTLLHRLSLIDNPDETIPLLPGESIHIGYVPMTETEAFTTLPKIPPEWSLAVSHFRMERKDITADQISNLIHRFIAINDAVERLVPKREYINSEPAKRIYESKIIHTWRNHRATILVSIIALQSNYAGEIDQFAINVNRVHGSVTAHRMFFHTLEQYVTSRGQSYPIIRPISIDRDALATAPPPENHIRYLEHLPLCKLQRHTQIDEPSDVYIREVSDEELSSNDL